jgi:hypothetical protein
MELVHDYRAIHRFSSENVDRLVTLIFGSNQEETRGGALSKKHSLELCLQYMSCPLFQIRVGEVGKCNQGTVSRKVHECIDAIAALAPEWIKFPENDSDIACAQQEWSARYQFPFCIGAVDGTQIKIERPAYRFSPAEYVCR